MNLDIGDRIGPYELLAKIGGGRAGVIFSAAQEMPVRRTVAVKFPKPATDMRQRVARFEAERQALALMDHPNIVRPLDGGTHGERPYFVMELISGMPITDYCERHFLPIRDRLKLFVQLCRAVQHAHQKGIIHRDPKPPDVLVTTDGPAPIVKLIDFGAAKAAGFSLTERTVVVTRFVPFIGTPMYTSPEQSRGLHIDTRSDIYSLGVLLYELLTSTTPFDQERFRTAGEAELCRIIAEEQPPKPSTRLSTTGKSCTSVALIRGELDSIVMKCLEKDPSRRCQCVGDLAKEIAHVMDAV